MTVIVKEIKITYNNSRTKDLKRIKKDSEIIFIPDYPTEVSQYMGQRSKLGDFGIMNKESNGVKALVIISAPEPIQKAIMKIVNAMLPDMLNS